MSYVRLVLAVVALILCAGNPAQALSVTTGLVAYYEFTGNTEDSVNVNASFDLSLQNAAALGVDRYGQADRALWLGGNDTAYASASLLPVGAKSIAFWIKVTGVPTNGQYWILGNGFATAQNGSRVGFDDLVTLEPAWEMWRGEAGTYNFDLAGTTTVPQNVWCHMAFTWDGSTTAGAVKFYVNGQPAGTGTASQAEASAGSESFYIGAREANRGHVGGIDDVAVWSRALSASEISQVYAESNPFPIAYYDFDAASITGSSMANRANAGDAAATIFGTTSVTGLLGQARVFDGVDDYIDLGAGAVTSRISGTQAWSISTWVYLTDADATGRIVAKGESTEAEGGLGVSNATPYVYVQGPASSSINATAPAALSLNVWHHLVGVRDSATSMKLYVDGVLAASASGASQSLDSTRNVLMGPWQTTDLSLQSFYEGRVDELRVFDHALAQADVDALFAIGVRFWVGGSGASWATAANWSPPSAPASGVDVSIQAGASPSAVTAAMTVRSLTLQAGFTSIVSVDAVLTITDKLVITSGTLAVGPTGAIAVTGTVTVDGGTLKGSIPGAGGAVTLTSGGTLKGSVAVGRAVVVGVGGRISPGE